VQAAETLTRGRDSYERQAGFVCGGVLIEDVVEAADGLVIRQDTHIRRPQSVFSFGPDYIHRVRHDPAQGVSLSIHAYTPASADALDYDVQPDGTVRALGRPDQVVGIASS
jgi:hypothetical protein